MDRVAKILLAVSASVAIAFAQASDTTAKQQSANQAASAPGATVAPTIGKTGTTNVTQKAPTNWSKIKDLFL